MIQDPNNKEGKIQMAYEIPLYMTEGAHLPCIKADHFIENCILDERLGKPSLGQLIAEGLKDHCISAHFDYEKRTTFDNWYELNQSDRTPSYARGAQKDHYNPLKMANDTYQYIETVKNEQFLVTRQGDDTLEYEPLTSQPPNIIYLKSTESQETPEEEKPSTMLDNC